MEGDHLDALIGYSVGNQAGPVAYLAGYEPRFGQRDVAAFVLCPGQRYALALYASDRRDQRHAARRHIDDLAGEFAAVGQHIAAKEVDAHALEAAALLAQGRQTRYALRQGHGTVRVCRRSEQSLGAPR